MFFESWRGLGRVLAVGLPAYVFLVALLRVSGNRTLSKMNAFDLVVTVALGSTLATVLLSRDVVLVEGLAALTLLVALQFAVTWSSVRSRTVDRLVKSEPALVVRDGEALPGAMRRARVTLEEIRAAVRQAGLADVEAASAVVLETDGTLSVMSTASGAILAGVRRPRGSPDEDTEHLSGPGGGGDRKAVKSTGYDWSG